MDKICQHFIPWVINNVKIVIIPSLSLHLPSVHVFWRMWGRLGEDYGLCGPHPSWLAKERVSTALRWPQRVQSTRTGRWSADFIESPHTASDRPLKLGVLHLCCHGFTYDLDSIWQSCLPSYPFSLLHPPGSPPGRVWRRSLAGKAAADMAVLGCQKAELRVSTATLHLLDQSQIKGEREWGERGGCVLTWRRYCVSFWCLMCLNGELKFEFSSLFVKRKINYNESVYFSI